MLRTLFHCRNIALLHKNNYHMPSSERTDSNKDMNQDSEKLSKVASSTSLQL